MATEKKQEKKQEEVKETIEEPETEETTVDTEKKPKVFTQQQVDEIVKNRISRAKYDVDAVKGDFESQLKQAETEAETYKKVLVLNPNNFRACSNLGFCYGCLKDWDNGIKYSQMAITLYPDFQLAKNNLTWMQDEKAKAENK